MYTRTYTVYGEWMKRLCHDIDAVTQNASDGSQYFYSMVGELKSLVNETIETSEYGRNLPSMELSDIADGLVALCRMFPEQKKGWTLCFSDVEKAAESLFAITDDMYVSRAMTVARKML